METLLGSSVLLFKSQLPHDGELPAGDRRETIWLVDFEQERYGHTGAGWKRSLTPPTRELPADRGRSLHQQRLAPLGLSSHRRVGSIFGVCLAKVLERGDR